MDIELPTYVRECICKEYGNRIILFLSTYRLFSSNKKARPDQVQPIDSSEDKDNKSYL